MVKKEVKAAQKSRRGRQEKEVKVFQEPVQIKEQLYFEDNITEKEAVQSNQPSQNLQIQQRKIRKQRKAKKHNPEDRFLKEHQKRYYLFPFIYSTENAFLKISWAQWKPNSVYKKMAKILSSCLNIPGKTSIQCKSYDQRMKFEHFIRPSQGYKQDLFQSALSYLEQAKLEPKDIQIILGYILKMGDRSAYMEFLQEVIQVQEIDCEQIKLECDIKREESSLTQGTKEYEQIFNEFLDAI